MDIAGGAAIEPPAYGDPHKPGSIRGFDRQPDPPGVKISVKFGQ
jgi:hypothetical protein